MTRRGSDDHPYRKLALAVSDAVWDYDVVRDRLTWAGKEELGGDAGELPDGLRWWAARIHPDDRSRFIANMTRWLRSDGGHHEHEYRLMTKSGVHRPVVDRGCVVVLDGKVQRAVGAIVPVTEQRIIEARTAAAQRLESIGRLAGGVAHDFNNILSAILGTTRIMLDDMAPDHELRPDIVQVTRAAERAASLTQQLLAFSRRQVLEPQVINVGTQLAEMQPMLARLIGEDVEITLAVSSKVAHVTVDPVQLEQVIMNLAVNARDAMPSGGRLTITAENAVIRPGEARQDVPPGSYVVMSVRDTGVGIHPSIRDRVFEPFFTTKANGAGTGLGLSTVFGIVKQSGGHVTFESEVDAGTTFRIFLPQTKSPLSVRQSSPSLKAISGRGRGELILLVEDEEPVRGVVRRTLERHGYRVAEAAHGGEALDLAIGSQRKIDLVLTDVVMPHLGGVQLVEKLRAQRPELKVILMSGYLETDADTLTRLEGVHFIRKPVTPQALLAKVTQILDEA